MKYAWTCAHCGGVAFITNTMPTFGERVSSTHWHHPDKSQVKKGDPCRCPSCGEQLFTSLAYIKALPVQSAERPQTSSSWIRSVLSSSLPSGSKGRETPNNPPGV